MKTQSAGMRKLSDDAVMTARWTRCAGAHA